MFVKAKPAERREARRLRGEGLSASGSTKRCPRCVRVLPAELFGRVRSGRQGWCRRCFRDYARERGSAHRIQVEQSKRRRREAARAFVQEHLRSHACADCGDRDPRVLEFDHTTETKTANVAQLVANGWSIERVRAEAALCEVVCANCHRRRTSRRSGWVRARPDWHEHLAAVRTARARNLAHIYAHLSTHGCVDCGERDIVVLDFDHVRGEKRESVARLASNGHSLTTVAAEIAKCEVRCANCHRRRTGEARGHWRALSRPGTP